jgi:glycerol-3-phosphate dehydrogenase
MKSRPEALREIESRSFDVCVIGAGATGAGCALDAQLRGLSTVVIDAGDFASATSSSSTKLAHGGVRYLQQAFAELDFGQLKVVREALRERAVMLANAPHLAHARVFLIPCLSRFESFYYGVGLKLYDWMAGKASLGPSRIIGSQQACALFPTLKRDGLAGAATYLDGQFDDARYGGTLIKSFTDLGGEAANYLRVVAFEKDAGGKLVAAVASDGFGKGAVRIRARCFVNATGPFSDHVRSMASPGVPGRLVLSKGVHLLLPLVWDLNCALLIPETEDGRVIFAIPWLGRLLVGTTDEEIASIEELRVSRAEAEYLLRHLNRYLTLQYTVEDVVSAFCGVRPLVRARHSRETKKLIREHEVEVDAQSGLISILGGKWTTYRVMAEDTINAVQKQLGSGKASGTANFRLAGADGYNPDLWKSLAFNYSISEETARHLAQKFGGAAESVLALANENAEWKKLIVEGAPPIGAEIVFCARHEMAVTIEDVLVRRIGLEYLGWKLADKAAPIVADHLAQELGWSPAQKEDELQKYRDRLRIMMEAMGQQIS